MLLSSLETCPQKGFWDLSTSYLLLLDHEMQAVCSAICHSCFGNRPSKTEVHKVFVSSLPLVVVTVMRDWLVHMLFIPTFLLYCEPSHSLTHSLTHSHLSIFMSFVSYCPPYSSSTPLPLSCSPFKFHDLYLTLTPTENCVWNKNTEIYLLIHNDSHTSLVRPK